MFYTDAIPNFPDAAVPGRVLSSGAMAHQLYAAGTFREAHLRAARIHEDAARLHGRALCLHLHHAVSVTDRAQAERAVQAAHRERLLEDSEWEAAAHERARADEH